MNEEPKIPLIVPLEVEQITTELQVVPKLDSTAKTGLGYALFGERDSVHRDLVAVVASVVSISLVRSALFFFFSPLLLSELAPVERERVNYWILLLSVIVGMMLRLLSRLGLYNFETTYFLLSGETSFILLAIDVIASASPFLFFPFLLSHRIVLDATIIATPRMISAYVRPAASSFRKRLQSEKGFKLDLLLALTLSTVLGSLLTYFAERVGGQAFVKSRVYEIQVPSILSADTLTSAEMMAHPLIPVPSLRSFLTPTPLEQHLFTSLQLSLLSLPLSFLLPLTPAYLADLVFSLIMPTSTLLLYNVFPIHFLGALGTGVILGLRGGVIAFLHSWTLEELSEGKRDSADRGAEEILEGDDLVQALSKDLVTEESAEEEEEEDQEEEF